MRHGSHLDPPNRFQKERLVADDEHWDGDEASLAGEPHREIELIDDHSQSLVTSNDSPDIPFRFSANPYRGCIHGCAYCYARNTHEYLGMNAGLDFETKIVVKRQAPELFRQFLRKRKLSGDVIAFSGVTDCYQPVEREFRLTRQCLEIALEFRQPVAIVTKNALVLRDLDILSDMAELNLVRVFLSINSLDRELARRLEPRTSIPASRLRAVQYLSEAGVPVGVMVAPVIPGLNDNEIPQVLEAAANAGAKSAAYILLRLPITVEPVFREWLTRNLPTHVERIEHRIRQTRHGKLNSSTWGERMKGAGPIADQIRSIFQLFKHKHGLDQELPPLDFTRFRDPHAPRQLSLFPDDSEPVGS
ncbi:MAG: PA0069 family radical SAM protein [Planctomycetaceae bacterium]